jgi:hypothetical protein
MIKDSFEGKIIRIDGFDDEDVTCRVFSSNKLQDEFKALSHQRTIQLSGKSVYRFEFSSVTFTKKVSLKLSLFADDGAQWLPLFDSDVQITELPEETLSPRFLIVLCKSKSLQTIEESGEGSEESSLIVSESEEQVKEDGIRVEMENKACETQEIAESLDSAIFDQSSIHEESSETSGIVYSEKFDRIWEPDSMLNESQDKVFMELIRENQRLKLAIEETSSKYQQICAMHEKEMRVNLEMDERLEKMLENYEEMMKRNQEREESLLVLVAEKENELKVAHEEIGKLRIDAKVRQIEVENLHDVTKGLNNSFALLTQHSYKEKINRLKTKLIEMQDLISKSNNVEYERKLREKDSIIQVLQQQLHRLRPYDSDTKESQNSSLSLFDELDESVRFHAKTLNLPEPILRDKEQAYTYGHRKLTLLLQNGKLMCRVGANLKPFKEYMEHFVLEKNIAKHFKAKFAIDQNIDSEYDADKFKEAMTRSRSSQNFLKNGPMRRKTKS